MILQPQFVMPASAAATGGWAPDFNDSLWSGCLMLLHGGTSTTIYDHVAESSIVLPTGVSWDDDALYFDQSSTAYLDLTSVLSGIETTGEGTLAVIAKAATSSTDLRLAGAFKSGDHSLAIWKDVGGAGTSWTAIAGDASRNIGEDATSAYTGDYQLVAVSRGTDGILDKSKLFTDSAFIGEKTNGGNFSDFGSQTFTLGKLQNLTPAYKGHARFLAVWDRALTDTEQSDLYAELASMLP